MNRKVERLERIKSIREKQTEILTRVTHVNGWFPAVYMSDTSQNVRLRIVWNLSVLNFRFFLLVYPGSVLNDSRLMNGWTMDSCGSMWQGCISRWCMSEGLRCQALSVRRMTLIKIAVPSQMVKSV